MPIFAGELRDFELPLRHGRHARFSAWSGRLLTIPFGATVSYAELARRIGRPGASRRSGPPTAATRSAIIVPCHRVIGADGTLTGYGGGLDRKEWLLQHEASSRPRRDSHARATESCKTPGERIDSKWV